MNSLFFSHSVVCNVNPWQCWLFVVHLIKKNPLCNNKATYRAGQKHSRNIRGNADWRIQQYKASNMINFILCTYIIEHYSNCFAIHFHFFTSIFFTFQSVLPNIHVYKIFLLIVQSNQEKYHIFFNNNQALQVSVV